MANKDSWVSPDGKIKKVVLMYGRSGIKPTENCECDIKISDTAYDVNKYNEAPIIIGESCDYFERLLDILITTMNSGEKAKVSFQLKEDIEFIIELKSFKSNGFIFEWDANKKYILALKHKEDGVHLFQEARYVDASHRFSKAIKLLASIPIPVDEPPLEVNKLAICEVYSLKSNLYNNLASCYLKHEIYNNVVELCKRVLGYDANNVKAMYKMAVAYYGLHDYDKALETLQNVLKLDPDNKAASCKLKHFIEKVNESNARVNAMFKKMFV